MILGLLLLLIVFSLATLCVAVLYKSLYRRPTNDEETISRDIPPPRYSVGSWASSWTNSWSWLRRYKEYQPIPTFPTSDPASAPVNPPTSADDDEPWLNVPQVGRATPHSNRDVDLERALPSEIAPGHDGYNGQGCRGGLGDIVVHGDRERPRISRQQRSRSISPYDLAAARGSKPIDIPTEQRERPTFPLPQKLIWKRLTPQERAGMVWWRN